MIKLTVIHPIRSAIQRQKDFIEMLLDDFSMSVDKYEKELERHFEDEIPEYAKDN